jgi:hypothetical protein
MYAVARMRQYDFVDVDVSASNFLRRSSVAVRDPKPVFTVLYDGVKDIESDLQFACMKTYLANDVSQAGPLESAANIPRSTM